MSVCPYSSLQVDYVNFIVHKTSRTSVSKFSLDEYVNTCWSDYLYEKGGRRRANATFTSLWDIL